MMVAGSSHHNTMVTSGSGLMVVMTPTGGMKKLSSDSPYDRHWYKIWCTDNTCKVVHTYDEVLAAQWNYPQHITHVEVIDAKKRGKSRGFS